MLKKEQNAKKYKNKILNKSFLNHNMCLNVYL